MQAPPPKIVFLSALALKYLIQRETETLEKLTAISITVVLISQQD